MSNNLWSSKRGDSRRSVHPIIWTLFIQRLPQITEMSGSSVFLKDVTTPLELWKGLHVRSQIHVVVYCFTCEEIKSGNYVGPNIFDASVIIWYVLLSTVSSDLSRVNELCVGENYDACLAWSWRHHGSFLSWLRGWDSSYDQSRLGIPCPATSVHIKAWRFHVNVSITFIQF